MTDQSTSAAEDTPKPASQQPEAGGDQTSMSPVEKLQAQALEARIVETLRTIFDPEIPINIYEMGLIYNVDVDASGNVDVRMTLTSPMCPVAESLPAEVQTKVKAVDGVTDTKIDLVWDPPWTPEKMSEAARLQLNL